MILIPAIDLLGGVCVRLTRGNYDRVERYSSDPVEVARRFAVSGARWIHLVDLDAARGSPPEENHNRQTIRRIAQSVPCTIEVGGGIRSCQDVEQLLEAGATRLIVGTTLVKKPEEVERWCAQHPGVLWAGIDADRGAVKIDGWERVADLQDVELAAQVRQVGLAGIVYTSIGRDGTLEGPDIEGTNRIAELSGLPVILSGGIGSIADVRRVLKHGHAGIEGMIIGKAIYRERIDLSELFGLVE